jgi:hypothetical protein
MIYAGLDIDKFSFGRVCETTENNLLKEMLRRNDKIWQ